MREINHLVLASNDLDAMRSAYAALGFTLAPRGQHPFGTGNSVIQLSWQLSRASRRHNAAGYR